MLEVQFKPNQPTGKLAPEC